MSDSAKKKRIAKNTLVLYVRMLFLMAISLYTSRVILQALGVEDFGVYNVVGGFVALFAILSKSLSSAASRFLNFTMGHGDQAKLADVFSTTLIIHVILAVLIAILAEAVGVWFVNEKMVISPERLEAANWVFQFSVLTFCLNLITVPYHAAIIAHERMSVFAYISIFEGVGKLLICYLVMVSPIDRLVCYAILMFMIHIGITGMNMWYCRRNFEECVFRVVYNKPLLKEIFSFASWNMIGSSSVILRNQGNNILINLFFGPVVNAARAVANQVLHAVHAFVENFYIALKPQITQSYANGNWPYMMTLIFQGSRLAYYMLLLICMPILLDTDYLLHLWLRTVPEHSVSFVQLTLVYTMIESISSPLITAQLATGKIRNYQLLVGGLQIMNVPISYIILKMGGIPETILYVTIFISVCCLCARLYMLKDSIHLNVWDFCVKVLLNILVVSIVSLIIPLCLLPFMEESFASFVIITFACFISTAFSIFFVGCKKSERQFVCAKSKLLKQHLFSK